MSLVRYTGEAEDQTMEKVSRIAAALLDTVITSTRRIGGSGNNRVYFLQCDDSRPRKYVAKCYFRNLADKRDRLTVEFNSLSFLSSGGVDNIPRPVAINPQESCAIYEFVLGDKISAEDLTIQDIAQAVDFLRRLKDLNKMAQSCGFAAASDACFSIKAIIANIEGRLQRFAHIEEGPQYPALKSFLENDFRPFLDVLAGWARHYCAQNGISFEDEIPLEERSLSPSDFGFHNALRTSHGRIVFLDFEYFGWDDPAKTAVDLLWHPAIVLAEPLKKEFVRRMLELFGENQQLAQRVELVYPLFGMKWCTILLNEFVAHDFSRRVYAGGDPLDRERICAEQLCKAKRVFEKIKETHGEFPYRHG